MKQLGGVTYIGVSLKDLNKFFKEDAVIQISKKFLKSYEMISGITETPKPIVMNVIETKVKSEIIEQPTIMVEPEKEAAPPVELNVSKGDW